MVCWSTVGGSGPPSGGRSVRNSASKARAGIAIAVSFNQYWNACTNVMDRIPPPTTLAMMITATATGPIQKGSPSRMFNVSPAPWYWGTR